MTFDKGMGAGSRVRPLPQYVDIASFIAPTHMGDPKHVIYVLRASTGGTDAILTGGIRDLIESHYGGVRVLSVRQFLDLHP